MLLIHIREFHRLSHIEGTGIWGIKSHNESEERCLTSTVRTNHTHDTIRREDEVQVVEELFLRERLRHMLCHNHLVTETRTIGDEDLQFLLTFLLLLIQHLIIGVQTGLSFRMTCLRRHTHPLQLAFEGLTTLRSLFCSSQEE